MMTWISLALALLKLVNAIVNWASQRELISQGYREALADMAMKIAARTATKKAIQEKIDAMSDDEVDQALRDLVAADRAPTKPMRTGSD